MAIFDTSFANPGSPRIVGSLTELKSGVLAWLECHICTMAMQRLLKCGSKAETVWCNEKCDEFVEAVGLGPEDPVADFVIAVCYKLCNEIKTLEANHVSAEGICTDAKMCHYVPCPSPAPSTANPTMGDVECNYDDSLCECDASDDEVEVEEDEKSADKKSAKTKSPKKKKKGKSKNRGGKPGKQDKNMFAL